MPSGSCLSATVSSLARAWRWREAVELFADHQRRHDAPSRTAQNALVGAMARGAHWQGAMHEVQRMGSQATASAFEGLKTTT